MKTGLVAAVAIMAAILFVSGCAAPGSKASGYCSADSDCTYYWYAGGCYTPENMKAIQEANKLSGYSVAEAKRVPGAYCTCEQNKCKMNVPAQGGAMVTIAQLAASPQSFIGKNVTIEGVLRAEGNMFAGGKFYLDDAGASIEVGPWAPLSVSTCPPSIQNCTPPKTISYYIGKKVRATGQITELNDSKFGIMKAFYIFIVNGRVEVIGEAEGSAMTKELCESGERVYWNAEKGQCICAGMDSRRCPEGYACVEINPNLTDGEGVCVSKLTMTRELCASARGSWENTSNGEACICAGEGRGCPEGFECRLSGYLSGSCVLNYSN